MSVVSTIDIVLMSVVFMEMDETKIVAVERDNVEPVKGTPPGGPPFIDETFIATDEITWKRDVPITSR